MDYGTALAIDVSVVAICAALLARFGDITHAHPGTTYLGFHVFTFTARLIGLLNGNPTLFSDWGPKYLPVREAEITRASLAADAVLVTMTLVWLLSRRASHAHAVTASTHRPAIDRRLLWAVVCISLPPGLWGLLTQAHIGGNAIVASSTDLSSATGYLLILPTWPGLCLLALVYVYGFRAWILIPLFIYIGIMGTQGYHRVRAIVPIIMLVQIWLIQNRKRWPSVKLVALLLFVGIVFFPLKHIGRMVQGGASFEDIYQRSSELVAVTMSGNSGDQQFLDQFASSMTLVDDAGHHYWGQPYLALLALPIPRAIWPEKPSITDYMQDFSRPWRPMSTSGMIVTMPGETYANFGYLGLIAIPAALAFVLDKLYRTAIANQHGTVANFAYVLVACNLLQVYRDGLTSLVFFVLVYMMPLAVLVLLHIVGQRRGGVIAQHQVLN